MSALVAAVRNRVPEECCGGSCRKGKCSVSIPKSMRPFVLIDLDHAAAPNTEGTSGCCDYLFIGDKKIIGNEKDLVAPLELKEGHPRASIVVKQLRAGACIAGRLVPVGGSHVAFRPVVISGGMNKYEREEFAKSKNKIKFRGESSFVTLHKCGKPLDQVDW